MAGMKLIKSVLRSAVKNKRWQRITYKINEKGWKGN